MSGKRHTDEFKAEAAKQVIDQNYSVREVSTRLGVSIDSLYAWVREQRKLPASLSVEKLRELTTMSIEGTSARVSADWLLTGRGTPLSDEEIGGSPDPAAARVEKAPVDARQAIEHFLDMQEGRQLWRSGTL